MLEDVGIFFHKRWCSEKIELPNITKNLRVLSLIWLHIKHNFSKYLRLPSKSLTVTRTLLPSVGLFGSVKYDIAATCCDIAMHWCSESNANSDGNGDGHHPHSSILMSMIITKEVSRFTHRSRTILNLPMQLWLPGGKLDNLDNNLLKNLSKKIKKRAN